MHLFLSLAQSRLRARQSRFKLDELFVGGARLCELAFEHLGFLDIVGHHLLGVRHLPGLSFAFLGRRARPLASPWLARAARV